jgi:uncharacterized protein YdeI (YjbR/CyaY-like superfamily)
VRDLEKALRFASRERWRKWLEKNHATKSEALLVIYKRPPKNERFPSHHALEEALCFGWIDGWFKPIDDERWVLRYSPRRKKSNWSKYNIARAWKLLNEGKMTPAGIARLPPDVLWVWETYKPPVVIINRQGEGAEIRFSDGKDYLSKIKMPALAP